jgi:hypothetical protein
MVIPLTSGSAGGKLSRDVIPYATTSRPILRESALDTYSDTEIPDKGTFRYDGGPAVVVPMPGETPPKAQPKPKKVPPEARITSRPARPRKLAYGAYGAKPKGGRTIVLTRKAD